MMPFAEAAPEWARDVLAFWFEELGEPGWFARLRNVQVTDAVANSPAWIAIDEAENRLHVQKALMMDLLRSTGRA